MLRRVAKASGDAVLPFYRMPPEYAPHACTWMSLCASKRIWGMRLSSAALKALANLATTISAFEPVKALVRAQDEELVRSMVGPGVELVVCQVEDMWARDTGAVFVRNGSGLAAVSFNFNGWGGSQSCRYDKHVASFMAAQMEAPIRRAELVLEGGGLEVDGEGTAILTESCILNKNRNRGWRREDVAEELAIQLGVKKIVWLPGVAGQDITDGHVDFYVRFVRPGVVVAAWDTTDKVEREVTSRHLELLRGAKDARGRTLEVHALAAPSTVRPKYDCKEFAAGYVNFYVCNGAVIAPEFGDTAADAYAHRTLASLFPGRTVVSVNIDAVAAGGGGIHCVTQQVPRV